MTKVKVETSDIIDLTGDDEQIQYDEATLRPQCQSDAPGDEGRSSIHSHPPILTVEISSSFITPRKSPLFRIPEGRSKLHKVRRSFVQNSIPNVAYHIDGDRITSGHMNTIVEITSRAALGLLLQLSDIRGLDR
jgi:hypothetical protein